MVLLKNKRKVFTLENLSYEPEVGVIHPGGATAAVGGTVSGPASLRGPDHTRRPQSHTRRPHHLRCCLSPQDGTIRLYAVQGDTLKDEGQTLQVAGAITDMAYSDDGAYLAVTDEMKVASVFTVADGYTVCLRLLTTRGQQTLLLMLLLTFSSQTKSEFYGHHAKPVTIAWSPDNEHFATGGMDMMVYVWTVGDSDRRIKIPGRTHTPVCFLPRPWV